VTAVHGGRREGAGRKPLSDGILRRLYSLTPRHVELLDGYRQRHGLRTNSAALRHMIESCDDLASELDDRDELLDKVFTDIEHLRTGSI
jgi:hypothetical protein